MRKVRKIRRFEAPVNAPALTQKSHAEPVIPRYSEESLVGRAADERFLEYLGMTGAN
jgi:hypothetical protein